VAFSLWRKRVDQDSCNQSSRGSHYWDEEEVGMGTHNCWCLSRGVGGIESSNSAQEKVRRGLNHGIEYDGPYAGDGPDQYADDGPFSKVIPLNGTSDGRSDL